MAFRFYAQFQNISDDVPKKSSLQNVLPDKQHTPTCVRVTDTSVAIRIDTWKVILAAWLGQGMDSGPRSLTRRVYPVPFQAKSFLFSTTTLGQVKFCLNPHPQIPRLFHRMWLHIPAWVLRTRLPNIRATL